jgi:hypothetical protein
VVVVVVKILGLLPLGTSLDTESPRSRSLGCWDALDSLHHLITTDFAPSSQSSEFSPSLDFGTFLVNSGFGPKCPQDVRDFWVEELKKNYAGEDGRKRIRMAAINLRDRDGLHLRAGDVKCPVLWLHVRTPFRPTLPQIIGPFLVSLGGMEADTSCYVGHRRRGV